MKSNLNNLAKQFLVTVGFLGTAIPVAKIASTGLKYLNLNGFVSSLITAPLSISAMHFLNRGNKNLDKWGLTVGSSAAALGLTQIISMPRFMLRFIMCFAVIREDTKPFKFRYLSPVLAIFATGIAVP